MTAPAPQPDTELTAALASAMGAWSIVRKGKQGKPPTVKRWAMPHLSMPAFMANRLREVKARAAWDKLDVREGWALLVDPSGTVIARQSGPWGVRGRGRW